MICIKQFLRLIHGEAELSGELLFTHAIGKPEVNRLGGLAAYVSHVRRHLMIVGIRVVDILLTGESGPSAIHSIRIMDRDPGLLLGVIVSIP